MPRFDLFQFTPLREGRPSPAANQMSGTNFNSRPCGRGDLLRQAKAAQIPISIHAPAGGATRRHGTCAG